MNKIIQNLKDGITFIGQLLIVIGFVAGAYFWIGVIAILMGY